MLRTLESCCDCYMDREMTISYKFLVIGFCGAEFLGIRKTVHDASQ